MGIQSSEQLWKRRVAQEEQATSPLGMVGREVRAVGESMGSLRPQAPAAAGTGVPGAV